LESKSTFKLLVKAPNISWLTQSKGKLKSSAAKTNQALAQSIETKTWQTLAVVEI
jgi:hypothetical protein